jgi:hypothetical protein
MNVVPVGYEHIPRDRSIVPLGHKHIPRDKSNIPAGHERIPRDMSSVPSISQRDTSPSRRIQAYSVGIQARPAGTKRYLLAEKYHLRVTICFVYMMPFAK